MQSTAADATTWHIGTSVASHSEDEVTFALCLEETDPLPHALAGGAHLLWQVLCLGPGTAEDLAERLAEATGATAEDLLPQLPPLLDRLLELRLVTPSEEALPHREEPGESG